MHLFSPKILTISEYLATVEDIKKRETVSKWIEGTGQMFARIRQIVRVRNDVSPEIRILDTDDLTTTEGNAYIIKIARGQIDYCYNLSNDILSCVDDSNVKGIDTVPDFVSTLACKWIIAHEFFHGARYHNDRISKEIAFEKHDLEALNKGVEYDADLCAVAYVYRTVQTAFDLFSSSSLIAGPVSDSGSRQTAFCILFSAIRGLPHHAAASSSHPSRENRINSTMAKLAIMGANDQEEPDVNFRNKESKERCDFLLQCLIRCERHFCSLHGGDPKELIIKLLEDCEKHDASHVAAWDSMSVLPYSPESGNTIY